MKNRLLIPLLLAVLFLLPFAGLAAAPPPSTGQISPHLLAQLEGGQPAPMLVILNEQADLSAADRLAGKTAKGKFVYRALWQTAQTSQAPLRQWLNRQGIPYRSFYIVNALLVEGDRSLALALAARPDVARLEANPAIRNSLPSPVPQTGHAPAAAVIESNLLYVNADDVWALGFTGQGIVVGGQDTGYDWDHPALVAHYRGWDGAVAGHNYNWHDSIHAANASCPADSPEPCDDFGHGTHTMGTAIGDDGAGNQIGMAPGATWMGCRNMNGGDGTPASYLECMEFFLAPYPLGGSPAQGNPELAPHVTVNSWTCPPSEGCGWDTLQAGIEAQRAAGIMTVAAAGNDGNSGCSTVQDPPGIYDAAYTIGALQKGADTLASFSSRGPVTRDGSNRRKPDLTAPGTSIRSAWRGGGYSFSQGTSMATPHVAGAVALLWSAVPSLTGHITATESYLNDAAVPIPSTACGSLAGHPNNLYGYGRLDVLAAVKAAQADFNFPPTADFDFSAPVYVGKTAVFTNLSTGAPPLTSTWNFGDGPLSFGGGTALLPVQHTFIAAGPHTVSLTMTNSLGQSTARHPVMVYRAGVALSPAAAARSGPYNTPLTFTLRLTNTGDLTDTFRLALEGAGRFTGAAPTATHISLLPLAGTRLTVEVSFPFSGTLPLPLTTVVTAASLGDPGRVATATLISLFTNIPDSPPTAAFTYTHYTSDTYPILVNQPATFINLTTGTLPITSTWDFGDGTPGVTIGTAFFPVQHTYAAFGSYTVTLTVTNKFGENVYADTITVTALNWMYLPLVLK